MAISKVTRRRGKEPKIMVAEPLLTVLLAKDNDHYCAKCPELDLVTELPTADAALRDSDRSDSRLRQGVSPRPPSIRHEP